MELGIVEGQPWTLQDLAGTQYWGRLKAIYQAVIVDIRVHELLLQDKVPEALTQLVRNLKTKRRCMLAGGNGTAAWPLACLEDPTNPWGLTVTGAEMCTVSGYLMAMVELGKELKQAQPAQAAEVSSGDNGGEGPTPSGGGGRGRGNSAKKRRKGRKGAEECAAAA